MQRLFLALAFLATATVVNAQSADLAPPHTGPVFTNYNPPAPSPARGGILYEQMELVTSEGTGIGGADESQNQSALGMTLLGANHANGSFAIADDFTVPAGETWTIESFMFYGYQTNSGPNCTMTGYFLQIWDGDPMAGGTVIAGDRTTNLFQGCEFSNIYRIQSTSAPGTDGQRPIMLSAAAFAEPLVLPAGTYWLEWSASGSVASGPWVPPVTIVGEATTGNAVQYVASTDTWQLAVDAGSGTQQGYPFQIAGTSEGNPGGGTVTVTSTDTPIPVPDGAPGGTVCGDPSAPAVSTISVSGVPGTVLDLDLLIDISATWIGDVEATLSHGATSAIVIDNPGAATPTACGNSTDDFPGIILDDAASNSVQTGPFPLVAGESYAPAFPLSAFNGGEINGDWVLSVTDGGEGDPTTLNSWAVIITPSGGVATEEGPNGLSELRVAPNPMSTQGQAMLRVASSQDVRVVLYDALGREVRVILDRALAADQTAHIAFRTDDLPAGVYVLRATGTDVSLTERITVVR